MNVDEIVDTVTIYGRVAFLLCIGEPFLELLTEDPGYPTALQAFGEAKRWLAGEDVAGDTVSDLLQNRKDEGILIYGTETQDADAKQAYIYLGGALGYVAWHIYEKADEFPSALVSEFSESAVPILVDYARNIPIYDEAYVTRVYDYILNTYQIEEGNELGVPINLENIKVQLGSRSVSSR